MVKKWWEMYGPEVTGSLDIDREFMARVLDDCDNKKWLACPSCRWHFEEAFRIKCEEIDRLKKVIEELKSKNKELSLRTIMTPSYYDLYNVNVELNKKIKVLEKGNKELEAKHQKALKVISRCKDEIDDKDILIETLIRENHVYRTTDLINRTYGLTGQIELLNKEIDDLRKENRDLKDTLEKDKEFGKYVGKLVADSIEEGCDKGVYKLNPDTRIDIHVEETNDMPTTFNRHAIPRIAIMFNNTQTEMERDTAEHECEVLNEKIDRLWSVNDELNREIKALEKENKGLKRTIAWFNDEEEK